MAENQNSSLPAGPNYRNVPGQEKIECIVGIHNLALKPGVSPQQFEQFITDNIYRVEDYPGWKLHMLKGQSGNRLDQYAVMLIIESLESLNSFHPDLDESACIRGRVSGYLANVRRVERAGVVLRCAADLHRLYFNCWVLAIFRTGRQRLT
ncbi:hypothetical protein [Yersinia sp. Marseille-Q3913]|uniref:hypothetical protein n=1 Tax=Yersinia sp. Marseille-Q3913 TaxID=2830769 RepID=UPI0030D79E0B